MTIKKPNRSDIYNTELNDDERAQAYLQEAKSDDPVVIENVLGDVPVLVTPYDRIELIDNFFMADEPTDTIDYFGKEWAMEYTQHLLIRGLVQEGIIPVYEAIDYVTGCMKSSVPAINEQIENDYKVEYDKVFNQAVDFYGVLDEREAFATALHQELQMLGANPDEHEFTKKRVCLFG
jgi:hypothetical protein